MLLEGWGYTPTASAEASRRGVSTFGIGFSDPQLLAVNDAAFTRPSAATVRTLRERHSVRWLFVDRRFPVDLDQLSKVATPRYRNGDYAVLEIR